MATQDYQLDSLQRWMQAVMTHPGGIVAGVESSTAQAELELPAANLASVVLPSAKRSSVERLAVYGNAYFARLLECMREFFPLLTQALGEKLFDQFALEYLSRYPPSSYTLSDLGEQFVPYLQATKPAEGDDTWPDFMIDLARLEWEIDQVFDGPGNEGGSPLSEEQLASISPDAWPTALLRVAPCVRVMAFRFPVNEYYTAARDGNRPALPQPRDSYLALTRRDYIVRRHELSLVQHKLLSNLVAGERVGVAIEAAAELVDDFEQFAANLHAWFTQWAAAGLFVGVDL